MKKTIHLLIGGILVLSLSSLATASPKGSPAAASASLSDADYIKVMKDFVGAKTRYGTFRINDKEAGQIRKLQLIRFHNNVHEMSGNKYYACADFRDIETGEMLDIDVDVLNSSGELKAERYMIHSVNGIKRYTYDKEGKRVTTAAKGSAPVVSKTKGSAKGSGNKGSY